LGKLLSTSFIALVKEVVGYRQLLLYWKNKITSSKFAWIFNDSILLPRKIHIFYHFLKRCWMKWRSWSLIIFGWIFRLSPNHDTHEDRYKIIFITDWVAFVWVVMFFGFKNYPPIYQRVMSIVFKDYFIMFMKLFLDDFNVFNDLDTL